MVQCDQRWIEFLFLKIFLNSYKYTLQWWWKSIDAQLHGLYNERMLSFLTFLLLLMYFELGIHLVFANNLKSYYLICDNISINLLITAVSFSSNVNCLNQVILKLHKIWFRQMVLWDSWSEGFRTLMNSCPSQTLFLTRFK